MKKRFPILMAGALFLVLAGFFLLSQGSQKEERMARPDRSGLPQGPVQEEEGGILALPQEPQVQEALSRNEVARVDLQEPEETKVPMTLEILASSEQGIPVGRAEVSVSFSDSRLVERKGHTDPNGRCAFLLFQPEIPGGDDLGNMVVTVSSRGFADIQHVEPLDRVAGKWDLRFTMTMGGTVRASVLDEHGNPVSDAVVLAHYLGNQGSPLVDRSTWPDDVLPFYRGETDSNGYAVMEDLSAGWWEIVAGLWREILPSEYVSVQVHAGQVTSVELKIKRKEAPFYASGRIRIPGVTNYRGYFLRRVDAPHRTYGVYRDGAFFVDIPQGQKYSMEVASMKDKTGSLPFEIAAGWHDLVFDVSWKKE